MFEGVGTGDVNRVLGEAGEWCEVQGGWSTQGVGKRRQSWKSPTSRAVNASLRAMNFKMKVISCHPMI